MVIHNLVIIDDEEVIRKLVIISSHKQVKVIRKHQIISNQGHKLGGQYFNYILEDIHNYHCHGQQL